MIVSTSPATKVVVGPPSSTRVTVDTPTSVDVTAVAGLPGPPGKDGQDGQDGLDGTSIGSGFVFHQGTPSSVWTIVHALPFYPNITVVDSSGAEVEGDVVYTNATTLTVTFSGAFSGTAYLS